MNKNLVLSSPKKTSLLFQHTKMEGRDIKEQVREAESFKRLTFFAIAISTVATLTAIIVVPMLYNYMQHVQSSLDEELEFCTHRSNGLWDQYRTIAGDVTVREKRAAIHRTMQMPRRHMARQAGYGGGEAPGTAPATSTAASAGYGGGSAPVASTASSGGGYGGGSAPVASSAASGGGSSGGSACSCGVGSAGPP
jgi:hypothetical protein